MAKKEKNKALEEDPLKDFNHKEGKYYDIILIYFKKIFYIKIRFMQKSHA